MDRNIDIKTEIIEIKNEPEFEVELMGHDGHDEIKREEIKTETLDHCDLRIKEEDPMAEDVDYSVGEIFTESEIKIEDTQFADAVKIDYECYLCKYSSLQNINDLRMHIFRHSNFKPFDPLECTKCSKKCVSVSGLKRHSFTHSDGRSIVCELCTKKFKTIRCIRQHMRIHIDAKRFACNECPKKMKTRNGLRIHLLIHKGEKPFHCELCSYKCTSSWRLLYHTRSFHTGEKTFVCAICSKRFSACADLAMHRRVHTGEKPFACVKCPKRFNQMQHLQRHKVIHEETREPFECNVCFKKLLTKYGLQIHMHIHTDGGGEKRFKCDFCAYESRYSSGLKSHMNVHQRRSFGCSQCPKVFTLKRSLVRHMRKH